MGDKIMITGILLGIVIVMLCVIAYKLTTIRNVAERQNIILLKASKEKLGDQYDDLMKSEIKDYNRYADQKDPRDDQTTYL